eukprot:2881006-Rhodomonas_salina.3
MSDTDIAYLGAARPSTRPTPRLFLTRQMMSTLGTNPATCYACTVLTHSTVLVLTASTDEQDGPGTDVLQ